MCVAENASVDGKRHKALAFQPLPLDGNVCDYLQTLFLEKSRAHYLFLVNLMLLNSTKDPASEPIRHIRHYNIYIHLLELASAGALTPKLLLFLLMEPRIIASKLASPVYTHRNSDTPILAADTHADHN
jgi:hypothetical protein